MPQPEPLETCRADVWLCRARFFKTRGVAAKAIAKRGVRVTRGAKGVPVDKPGKGLHVGDVLVLAQGERWLTVRVLGFGERRGPASEARALYERAGEGD